jgi:phenylpyruvate tautomerase PptA (4-oxalocrotonate tautomerase family)
MNVSQFRDRSNAMTDKHDIDRVARRAKHATKKLAHQVSDGATELVDDGRETVRIAFEKIKAARIGAEKKKEEEE